MNATMDAGRAARAKPDAPAEASSRRGPSGNARRPVKSGVSRKADPGAAPHPARRNDPGAILALWESCVGLSSFECEDALLRTAMQAASASSGASADPPTALGERNAQLLDVHAQLFGRRLDLLSHCPACATAAQFTGDCAALAAACRTRGGAGPHGLTTHGYSIEFRLPDAADVIAAASASAVAFDVAAGPDPADAFARRLLARCVLACREGERDVPFGDLPRPVLDALSAEMESLDPGAAVSFSLACPACGERWEAPLDAGDLVWQKLRTAAERLLLEVDALARAYGWTEAEVLALSPTRRAAYLQLAG